MKQLLKNKKIKKLGFQKFIYKVFKNFKFQIKIRVQNGQIIINKRIMDLGEIGDFRLAELFFGTLAGLLRDSNYFYHKLQRCYQFERASFI